jgi:hypothetical protein
MASDSFVGFLSALLFLSLSRENNTVASSWSHSLINFALDLFGIPVEISWQSRHMMMVVLMMVVVIMMVIMMVVIMKVVKIMVMMMVLMMMMMMMVVLMMLVLLIMVEVLVHDYDVNLVCIYIKVDLCRFIYCIALLFSLHNMHLTIQLCAYHIVLHCSRLSQHVVVSLEQYLHA